jgi:hypothetical protein
VIVDGVTVMLETVASGLSLALARAAVVRPFTAAEPAGPAPSNAATIHAVHIFVYWAYAALMV